LSISHGLWKIFFKYIFKFSGIFLDEIEMENCALEEESVDNIIEGIS
jgi:hypothetical protein